MCIDRNTVLCPGMVITIEPGVYIPVDFHCSRRTSEELVVISLPSCPKFFFFQVLGNWNKVGR